MGIIAFPYLTDNQIKNYAIDEYPLFATKHSNISDAKMTYQPRNSEKTDYNYIYISIQNQTANTVQIDKAA